MYEKLREVLRGRGIRLVPYKTATATGAQAQETEFDITSIGKLMDERMVTLPFRLTDLDTQQRMGELITQFLRWRPRPAGKTSWHLQRDIVMATLFAESEARRFVRYAQAETNPTPSSAPRWATNGSGGFSWMRPKAYTP
jgi:hypothetical protein